MQIDGKPAWDWVDAQLGRLRAAGVRLILKHLVRKFRSLGGELKLRSGVKRLAVENARVTVIWNGVVVHNNVEINGSTGGGIAESPAIGPIRLQDHGDPIAFRNIRIRELPAGGRAATPMP